MAATPIVELEANQLSREETARFAQLIDVIERGQCSAVTVFDAYEKVLPLYDTAMEVSNAIREIRDQRLYRSRYKSFTEFCRDSLNIGDRNANRMIEMGAKRKELGVDQSVSDSAIRELSPIRTTEGKREAIREAIDTAPKDAAGKPRVTASHVEKVVAKRTNRVSIMLPKMSDDAGVEVPERLTDTFKAREKFDLAIERARGIRAILKELEAVEGVSTHLSGQMLDNYVENIVRKLQFATPTNVCPHCGGEGPCIACKGLGWLTAEQFKRVPEDMRGAI